MQRETMKFDIVIVGAGPAGLSAAIRLAQLNQQLSKKLSIAVLEKGAEVGSHILAGAVLEPRALDILIPDWQAQNPPPMVPVIQDQFLWLTKQSSRRFPTPPPMRNHGNYIISLGLLCRWLAQQAQALGVEIFTGFPGADLSFTADRRVDGVITGDFGISKTGQPTERYQAGVLIQAQQTLLAEGCRGSLSKKIIAKFELRAGKNPQTYGLGIKELWEVKPEYYQPGKVIHTVGWPLDNKIYGGGFLYHWADNKVAVGFVVGLDYRNPYLDPFAEMQRFKMHPAIQHVLRDGRRIGYGARALNEGGWQGLPKLTFPGGMLIGCAAGFLNVPKIKGIHTAMQSGMIAAETIFAAAQAQQSLATELTAYTVNIEKSWIYSELYRVRNIRPALRWGLWPGLAYAALDTYILRGHAPWTLKYPPDYISLIPAQQAQPIAYPQPDQQLTFDKLSSVYLSNTLHNENQLCHLQLKDPTLAITVNYQQYASPETRYCPAQVYEIVQHNDAPQLQINAANCLHCKACDIKDPTQNINWVPPEGGGGPDYREM